MNMHLSARQYTSASEMLANAAAIRKRLMGGQRKPIAKPASPPATVIQAATKPATILPFWMVYETHFDSHLRAWHTRRIAMGIVASDGLDIAYLAERRWIKEIVDDVLLLYPGVTLAEVKSQSRARRLIIPRQHAMYDVRRQRPDLSFPSIGQWFGDRDHTTVIHAVRKIEAMRAKEEI